MSENFIGRVTDLASFVDGKAAAIIGGLERGEVSRFHSSKTEELREFLEAEGYLPLEDPLEPDNVRVRVMAAVAEELRTGVVSTALVDRIIAATGPAA